MVAPRDSLISIEQEFIPLLPCDSRHKGMCRIRAWVGSPCPRDPFLTPDTYPIIEELLRSGARA